MIQRQSHRLKCGHYRKENKNMENIGTIKVWNIEAMTGYKPRTTFYEDFSIADAFGGTAI